MRVGSVGLLRVKRASAELKETGLENVLIKYSREECFPALILLSPRECTKAAMPLRATHKPVVLVKIIINRARDHLPSCDEAQLRLEKKQVETAIVAGNEERVH